MPTMSSQLFLLPLLWLEVEVAKVDSTTTGAAVMEGDGDDGHGDRLDLIRNMYATLIPSIV